MEDRHAPEVLLALAKGQQMSHLAHVRVIDHPLATDKVLLALVKRQQLSPHAQLSISREIGR